MHREIIGAPAGIQVDHINRNGLDNQRINLRLATPQQQAANRRRPSGVHSSQYKGVTWHSGAQRWQAQIEITGRTIYLGLFTDEHAAAAAYEVAAKAAFGPFACSVP
jgi:hypothetical protein